MFFVYEVPLRAFPSWVFLKSPCSSRRSCTLDPVGVILQWCYQRSFQSDGEWKLNSDKSCQKFSVHQEIQFLNSLLRAAIGFEWGFFLETKIEACMDLAVWNPMDVSPSIQIQEVGGGINLGSIFKHTPTMEMVNRSHVINFTTGMQLGPSFFYCFLFLSSLGMCREGPQST